MKLILILNYSGAKKSWLAKSSCATNSSDISNDNVIKHSMIDKMVYEEKRKEVEQDDDMLKI